MCSSLFWIEHSCFTGYHDDLIVHNKHLLQITCWLTVILASQIFLPTYFNIIRGMYFTRQAKTTLTLCVYICLIGSKDIPTGSIVSTACTLVWGMSQDYFCWYPHFNFIPKLHKYPFLNFTWISSVSNHKASYGCSTINLLSLH